MVNYKNKAPLTRDLAAKIANRRSHRRGRARVARNASRAYVAATSSNDAGGAGVDRLARSIFASSLELAEAERDATERMQAAAQVTPLIDDEGAPSASLMVHVDGVMPFIERARIVELLRDASDSLVASDDWPLRDDLHLATFYAPLFWNCALHCGGSEAVRAAECSVVRATIRALVEDEERRAVLLDRAGL